MRVLGIVGLVTLGLGLVGMAGCEDAKSPSVSEEFGWAVKCESGGGCASFQYHTQTSTMYPREFDVDCSVKGDAVSFTIRDPGVDPTDVPPGWAPGSISVTNGNPAQSGCNVTVTDTTAWGAGNFVLTDSCASSGGGGCVLTRITDPAQTANWQWVGTLRCNKLTQLNAPTKVYSLTGYPSGEVTIKLANCN